MIDSTLEQKILNELPYSKPFHFVESISSVDEATITGHYTFSDTDFFYKGHFTHKPVTPGVILVECMGQIGMVSHLIYILKLYDKPRLFHPLLTNMEVDFLNEVKVGESLTVKGTKVFYRNDSLRSVVEMYDVHGVLCVRAKFLLRFIFERS